MSHPRHRLLAAASAIAFFGCGLAAPAPAGAAPAVSAPTMSAAVNAATVTLGASPRTAKAGQAVTFTGRAPAKAKVSLQYYLNGKWRALGSTTATRAGTYKLVAKHVGKGNIAYRITTVMAKRTVTSGSVVVAWARPAIWYPLSDYRPASGYLDRSAVEVVGDNSYDFFVGEYGSGDEASTWTLNGKCSRLTGIAGSGTDRSSDTRRQVEVLADGDRLFSEWFIPGESTAVDVSLAGRKRVSISVRHQGDYNGGRYGVGNAKVLCTQPPGEYDAAD